MSLVDRFLILDCVLVYLEESLIGGFTARGSFNVAGYLGLLEVQEAHWREVG